MAIPLLDNVEVLATKPQDPRYFHPSNRPWASVNEVLTELEYRHTGLLVNINGVVYWFKEGVADANLVIFIPDIDFPEIVNNLTTEDPNKSLSAEMGVRLLEFINGLSITSNQAAQELYLRVSFN